MVLKAFTLKQYGQTYIIGYLELESTELARLYMYVNHEIYFLLTGKKKRSIFPCLEEVLRQKWHYFPRVHFTKALVAASFL